MTLFTHEAFDDHEFVHHIHDADTGLRAIVAVHNATLGPGLGGLRVFNYASDDEALTDVLRLSRGMTYKNALAGIPYGGGKAVILGDPASDKSPALMYALGRALNKLNGHYITAEDVGTTVADMDYIRKETPFARGTSHGVGDPSPFTAKGVRHAIHAAVKSKLGIDNVEGVKISIQGLGNVGYALAQMLHIDGATLIVTDVNAVRLAQAKNEMNATTVKPDEIYDVKCDLFAPCAMGASINNQTIGRLKALIVCGAANNQLALSKHGQDLHNKGILYVPDFVANAGGVINIALEDSATSDVIMARVDEIRGTVDEILERATDGNLPLDVAEALAMDRIHQYRAETRAA